MNGYGMSNLQLSEVPRPEPQRGEVLVKVAAVSLNVRDQLVIDNGQGAPVAFPFTPASDMAGTVVAIGQDAEEFAPGDRVISSFFPDWLDGIAPGNAQAPDYSALGGRYQGVLADYVALPKNALVRAPSSISLAQASTLPCAGLPAWFALVESGKLRPGERVLVQGTGGVALFAVQIAKAYGAEVFVTTGSPAKRERVRALGADHIISRTEEDWVAAIHRLTAGHGVDHVIELAGGTNLGRSLEAVAVGGRISLIGVLDDLGFSGASPTLILKAVTVQGIRAGHRRSLENFVRAVEVAGIAPVIGGSYDMADVPAALAHLARGPFGKIVVNVDALEG
ncbi:NAD(P)-dependent alcohol dehydrogenase [Ralstonia pseudosolanacearum]|uniref:zinc-dependent alcohol dehydrogenase family protein n=1 Tax=Ralstonia pseudosolanacearum TaxID=1310165 RepID=UPI003862F4F3